MPDFAVVADRGNAIPLIGVAAEDFTTWRDAQDDAVKARLDATGFTGDAGAFTWIPAPGERVLTVFEPEDPLHALADLPYRLPEGRYRPVLEMPAEALSRTALGWGLGSYRFTRYKRSPRQPAVLVLDDRALAERIARRLAAIYLTRDLINTPAADMLPRHMAEAASDLALGFGADIEVIEADALTAGGLHAIHAVGRASADPPRLIDLTWGDPRHPHVALIGKGVAFDSGGLNIKPGSGMRLMKKDMGGAAHVLGLARLIMSEALPVHLRVLVPAVENAISGNAFRPGDVLGTHKGLTVEVDNTDAEGRLILADALSLASEAEPALIIDFATLTGAARVALGTELPAMFTNDDDLAAGLLAAAARSGDPFWRLPLHAAYKPQLESRIADLVNAASSGYAGAITAALFLEHFVGAGIAWAHFDLMAWNLAARPGHPEGGEAMGLLAVYDYLLERFG